MCDLIKVAVKGNGEPLSIVEVEWLNAHETKQDEKWTFSISFFLRDETN